MQRIEAIDVAAHLPKREARCENYAPGDSIYPAIHLIQDGEVVVKMCTISGKYTAIDLYGPEDFFGTEGLTGTQSTVGICTTKVTTLSWEYARVRELMKADPELAIGLLEIEIRHSRTILQRLATTAGLKTPGRLAAFLLERAKGKQARWISKSIVEIPKISHGTISEFLRTTRAVATNGLGKLRRAGYIQYENKRRTPIKILNMAGLEEWVKTNGKSPAIRTRTIG